MSIMTSDETDFGAHFRTGNAYTKHTWNFFVTAGITKKVYFALLCFTSVGKLGGTNGVIYIDDLIVTFQGW
jgi:hypothetical protein